MCFKYLSTASSPLQDSKRKDKGNHLFLVNLAFCIQLKSFAITT